STSLASMNGPSVTRSLRMRGAAHDHHRWDARRWRLREYGSSTLTWMGPPDRILHCRHLRLSVLYQTDARRVPRLGCGPLDSASVGPACEMMTGPWSFCESNWNHSLGFEPGCGIRARPSASNRTRNLLRETGWMQPGGDVCRHSILC